MNVTAPPRPEPTRIEPSDRIAGVLVVTPQRFGDARGVFVETYRRSWFPGGREMVQQNRSDRQQGAVVGLHYHLHQADYWYVPRGRALVVLHDLRIGSPTDGNTQTLEIGEHDHRGVYIPPGLAHGFAALTDLTMIYLVDQYYNPADELGVLWNDPALGVSWPFADPVISERDRKNPRRAELPESRRPHYGLRT